MSLNWDFQKGGGFKPKTLRGGSMDIFWNNTCKYLHDKKCIPMTERKGSKITLLNISVSTLLVLLD